MKGRGFTGVWADRIRFRVKGGGARAFLSGAVREGVRLSDLSCVEGGYTGAAAGTDLPRLRRAARAARAELVIETRRGPGGLMERCAARPGLLVGLAAFFLLQWYLGGFLWHIDFGELEAEQCLQFREVLAQEGIWEGCRIDEEELRRVQQAIEPQLQQTGWIGLNFVSGCLFVEVSQSQTQTVRETLPQQALYAKAGGQVIAIELESGFAEVAAGQYVAEGQLLANGQKADRDGNAVVQGARGRVLGRVQKTYTAVQPLETETDVLTGERWNMDVWQLLGRVWQATGRQEETAEGEDWVCSTEWLPLQLGRAALPGCLCRTTFWRKQNTTIFYSEETAQALAARSCRLQLLQQFPDAVVESAQVDYQRQGEQIVCTAEYVFCADMAQPGELSPLESVQNAG